MFAELEDNLPKIECVADQLSSSADGKSLLVDEGGGAVGLQKLRVLVGNREWLKQNGYEVTTEVEALLAENEMTGQTVVLAGIEGDLIFHLSCIFCAFNEGYCVCLPASLA